MSTFRWPVYFRALASLYHVAITAVFDPYMMNCASLYNGAYFIFLMTNMCCICMACSWCTCMSDFLIFVCSTVLWAVDLIIVIVIPVLLEYDNLCNDHDVAIVIFVLYSVLLLVELVVVIRRFRSKTTSLPL